MSRISQTITSVQAQGRKVLIPYIVAGDPCVALTVPLMHALVASGADIIELGVPFSDPSSDGTVIQLGGERALRAGTTLHDIFAIVREFREQDTTTPIVLMGYLNPVETMGYEAFATALQEAGGDGVLIVDLPTYESEEFAAVARPKGLDMVFLVAPTTTESRLESICQHTSGYLYYVSLKGVTGAAITDKTDIRAKIDHLRDVTDLPIIVGFGIKDGVSAREMAAISDGVIVGSALVDKISHLIADKAYTQAELAETVGLIKEIRGAVDAL
jgi:tryptophan synthase alpha chain